MTKGIFISAALLAVMFVFVVLLFSRQASAKDYKVINVQFFEDTLESPMAESNLSIEQLPETFEIDTIFDIGDDKWRVIKAMPMNKSEFQETGKLSLIVKKHEAIMMDPHDILYSLPTISNDYAPVKDADSFVNMLVLIEDDWRTVEFVSAVFASEIDEEIASVLDIYEKHQKGQGFTSLHVRQKIPAPFGGKSISIEQLRTVFDIEKTYAGVAFTNARAIVVNGFAFKTKSGEILWGNTDNENRITFLNLQFSMESNSSEFPTTLDGFLEENKLYLVNWPRTVVCGPGKKKTADCYEYFLG